MFSAGGCCSREYSNELERSLAGLEKEERFREIQRLTWNLRMNPSLSTRYPAARLRHLSDAELAKGSRAELARASIEEKHIKYQQLLADRDENQGAMRCRGTANCPSDRFEFLEFQTRSADEGTDYFVLCKVCKKQWKHQDDSY